MDFDQYKAARAKHCRRMDRLHAVALALCVVIVVLKVWGALHAG